MNLELNHLAPYLPYGLKVKHASKLGNIKKEATLTMADYTWLKNQKYLKPLLKPLSQFEYDHIIQVKEHLGLGQWCDHYDQYFDAWFDDAESVHKLVLQCPYEIMQFFLECHFDVFGLINAGLATELR